MVVVRGEDGGVRGFYNVCRHRAARLLDGASGECGTRIVCPYHAWTYALDGRLDRAAGPRRPSVRWTWPAWAGAGASVEIYRGFVFVRMEGSGPTVAEMMAPYDAELDPYRLEDCVPLGRVTLRDACGELEERGRQLLRRAAHPRRPSRADAPVRPRLWRGGARMGGQDVGRAARHAVARRGRSARYRHLLPDVAHLPPERRRLWTYYKLWPNVAFDVYPDQIDFMQMHPALADAHDDPRDRLCPAGCATRDARRPLPQLAHQPPGQPEDTRLIEGVQHGMASRSYTVGPLGEGEVSLRSFGRRIRELLPQARSPVRI